MDIRKRILFLCTGNSCRSQIAEAFARHYYGSLYEIHSAGIEAHGLNPKAVEVIAEEGIDMKDHHSKTLDALKDYDFDLIVTVCGDAHEKCPTYLKKGKVIHKGFPDPAKAEGSDEELMNQFRVVRDEIRVFIQNDLLKLIDLA